MKKVIISGATSGLGYETVRQMLRLDYAVIGLGRNEAALKKMKAELPGAFSYYVADFSDLASVARATDQIRADHAHIDVLINNAAVNMMERRETKQGFEMHFGVNYLASFALTYRLITLLEAAPQGRVVNVGAIQLATRFRWDDYNLTQQTWDNTTAVTNAKLAMFMFTKALADRQANTRVTVNVLDPGLVRTPYHDKSAAILKFFVWLMGKPEEKVVRENYVWLATDESLGSKTGGFFSFKKEKHLKGDALDKEEYDRIWDLSRQLCTLD